MWSAVQFNDSLSTAVGKDAKIGVTMYSLPSVSDIQQQCVSMCYSSENVDAVLYVVVMVRHTFVNIYVFCKPIIIVVEFCFAALPFKGWDPEHRQFRWLKGRASAFIFP